MAKRKSIRKRHRPLTAATLFVLSIGTSTIAYEMYRVGQDAFYSTAALLGYLLCLLWFLVSVALIELAFEFHVGRRQASQGKRNRPILAFGSLALATLSASLAYEVVCRAIEARVFDMIFGVYLAVVWGLTAIVFVVVAFEFQSRKGKPK